MYRRVLHTGGFVFLSILMAVLGSCTVTITKTSSSISGTVVDARSYTAAGISGVSVTITSVSYSSYTATTTTDSSGAFSFADLDSTKSPYVITATLSPYFIPPVRVNQNGYSIDIGDIPALSLSSSDISGLSFIAVWNASAASIDEYMSFPDADNSASLTFTTPYSDTLSNVRDNVYYNAPVFPVGSTYANATVYLDYNSAYTHNTSGASTITMRTIPFSPTTYSYPSTSNYPVTMDSANDINGLYATFGGLVGINTRFRYMGATEVYLNAATGSLTSSASASSNPNLAVYCIQTLSGPTGSYIAKFTLPQEMSITSASIARINMFEYYDPDNASSYGYAYQIVPDQQVIPQGPTGTPPFKSISGATAVFGVLGK